MGKKRQSTIFYDDTRMYKEATTGQGIDRKHYKLLEKKLDKIRVELPTRLNKYQVGFLAIPEQQKEISKIIKLSKQISAEFETLIVVGIGGSDLGARVFIRALRKTGKMNVRFIGANTDPEELAELLAEVDLKKSAINIISKSGDTIEPMTTFLIIRDKLIKAVGKQNYAKHIVATTDAKHGTLRTIADREGFRTLSVPDSIGGRFSALTTVGLFPAACAGIDIKALIAGAKIERERFLKTSANKNDVLIFTGLHYLGYTKQNRSITVLMPYSAKLDTFGQWFRQLWAESLGKKITRTGREVNLGLTPVSALGATDQHSQIQLYNEGPTDKMVTFIEVDQFRAEFVVPKAFLDLEKISYMTGHKFGDILRKECQSTGQALADNGKPNGTIHISTINEETVGSLMMFFMLATAVMGELLNIDAYNQPGVEGGKKLIISSLQKNK